MTIDDLHRMGVYSLPQKEKERVLSEIIIRLAKEHYERCLSYRRIVDFMQIDLDKLNSYYDLPFLPVRLFKIFELRDIPETDIFKTMTSSGTTGQSVSRIYLDKENALLQQKVLMKILTDIIRGGGRLPMLIVDSPDVIGNRRLFSARGAALMSIGMMGRDVTYILNEDMSLNTETLLAFAERHKEQSIVIFGMTYMIWKHFYIVSPRSFRYDRNETDKGCFSDKFLFASAVYSDNSKKHVEKKKG